MSEREFSACWFRVRDPLYRHAMQQLALNEFLADDVIGRLLITLCRQRENMPSERGGNFNFYAHSRKMLKYALCRQWTRQNTRKRKGITVSLELQTEEGEFENPDVLRQEAQRQREAAYRAERSAALSQTLRSVELPDKWARAYVMRVQGEKFEDIGKELKVTRQAACQMYQKVVQRLRWMHMRQESEGRDDGSLWTGEQLHTWGSAVSIA